MDQNLIYVAIAVAAYFFLPKLGIKLPSSTPTDLPSLIKSIIDAVLAEILPKIPSKEDVQQIVKSELAARQPVGAQVKPDAEVVDGKIVVTLPK